MEIVQHVTDDTLERYAMQTLPDSECGPLVDHLLVCPGCRERLKAADVFVAAMTLAAAEIREAEKS